MSQINEFQMRCQSEIQTIAAAKGITTKVRTKADVFEINKLAIGIQAGSFDFWLYPDGADISGLGLDERFEIYDFKSLPDLEARFLDRSKQLLDRI